MHIYLKFYFNIKLLTKDSIQLFIIYKISINMIENIKDLCKFTPNYGIKHVLKLINKIKDALPCNTKLISLHVNNVFPSISKFQRYLIWILTNYMRIRQIRIRNIMRIHFIEKNFNRR